MNETRAYEVALDPVCIIVTTFIERPAWEQLELPYNAPAKSPVIAHDRDTIKCSYWGAESSSGTAELIRFCPDWRTRALVPVIGCAILVTVSGAAVFGNAL